MNGNLTPAEEARRAIDPWRRADLIRDLIDLAAYYATHTDVPIPDRCVFPLPVHGDSPAERDWDVLETARKLDVSATTGADGCRCASRQIGTLTLEARTPARKAAAA